MREGSTQGRREKSLGVRPRSATSNRSCWWTTDLATQEAAEPRVFSRFSQALVISQNLKSRKEEL